MIENKINEYLNELSGGSNVRSKLSKIWINLDKSIEDINNILKNESISQKEDDILMDAVSSIKEAYLLIDKLI